MLAARERLRVRSWRRAQTAGLGESPELAAGSGAADSGGVCLAAAKSLHSSPYLRIAYGKNYTTLLLNELDFFFCEAMTSCQNFPATITVQKTLGNVR